jgi:hypothetical protein
MGASTIRIDTTIDNHRFEIVTGYRGANRQAESIPQEEKRQITAALAAAKPSTNDAAAVRGGCNEFLPTGGGTCPCCPA